MPDQSPEQIEQRRARRAERRDEQMRLNVDRAAKMHAARMEDASGLDVSQTPQQARRTVNVGCSGWYYWHWKGHFYPDDIPRAQWFPVYQGHFNTVELNAPFYGWPTVTTVKSWIRQANEDFVYTIKVCELITHVKRFDGTEDLVKDFGYVADLLGQKMGCLLFQLPPSIKYDPETLKVILSQLEPRHRNVVEFRHKSWWTEEVFAAFARAGAIFCSISGPRLPDTLIKTADDIYIRFHGVERWYRHDYTEAELQIWVDRITASGAKTVWIYFNNDRDGFAIKNAKLLSTMLGAA